MEGYSTPRPENGIPSFEQDEQVLVNVDDVRISAHNRLIPRFLYLSVLQVHLHVDGVEPVRGNMVVSSQHVYFVPNAVSGATLKVHFRSISLHAISRDAGAYHLPCIYAQLAGATDEESVEVRFVPEDSTKLQALYDAFCTGAELNPDPDEG
jgi:hypothetical protein